jgi:vancomycin aglycone glucosyltransferase
MTSNRWLVGLAVRPLLHGPTPASAPDAPRRAAELIAEQFGPVERSVARSGHQVRSARPDAPPRALVHATATRS